MGYQTDFDGGVVIRPQMKPEHMAYINAFAGTRRSARNPALTARREDPVRIAAGLPIGEEGGYFVGENGFMGQGNDGDLLPGIERPPIGQPGHWCQWVVRPAEPDENAPTASTILEWDGGEKFYEYVEWMEYLIEHFFSRWGYTLNGEISWQGEEPGDIGLIIVDDSKVTQKMGRIVYR